MPLTVGNGSLVVRSVVTYTIQKKVSTHLLVCSGFAKALTLGLSMHGGFVGGVVFPMITMGTIAACVCNQLFPEVPIGLALGCFLSGLPCSLVPMPFTFSLLMIFIFHFGLYQTVPIFITTVVSYSIVVGTGIYNALIKKGDIDNEKIMNPGKVDEELKTNEVFVNKVKDEDTKRLEEQYAFEKYFNTKKLQREEE